MKEMFAYTEALTLDVSNFNTSKVTDMESMFDGVKVTSLNLSSFDTKNVTNMSLMFNGINLSTLDLSSFDISNLKQYDNMFNLATKLEVGYAKSEVEANFFNELLGKEVFTATN